MRSGRSAAATVSGSHQYDALVISSPATTIGWLAIEATNRASGVRASERRRAAYAADSGTSSVAARVTSSSDGRRATTRARAAAGSEEKLKSCVPSRRRPSSSSGSALPPIVPPWTWTSSARRSAGSRALARARFVSGPVAKTRRSDSSRATRASSAAPSSGPAGSATRGHGAINVAIIAATPADSDGNTGTPPGPCATGTSRSPNWSSRQRACVRGEPGCPGAVVLDGHRTQSDALRLVLRHEVRERRGIVEVHVGVEDDRREVVTCAGRCGDRSPRRHGDEQRPATAARRLMAAIIARPTGPGQGAPPARERGGRRPASAAARSPARRPTARGIAYARSSVSVRTRRSRGRGGADSVRVAPPSPDSPLTTTALDLPTHPIGLRSVC